MYYFFPTITGTSDLKDNGDNNFTAQNGKRLKPKQLAEKLFDSTYYLNFIKLFLIFINISGICNLVNLSLKWTHTLFHRHIAPNCHMECRSIGNGRNGCQTEPRSFPVYKSGNIGQHMPVHIPAANDNDSPTYIGIWDNIRLLNLLVTCVLRTYIYMYHDSRTQWLGSQLELGYT